MWEIAPTDLFERLEKRYAKKRPAELTAVLRNLLRYLDLLNAAPNSKAVQAGFLHREPAGVIAVDQKGGGASLAETRLYTLADDSAKVLHLIVIGDKGSQANDIQISREFAQQIKEISQQNENKEERPAPQRAAVQKRDSDAGSPKHLGRNP